ncbi:single-stranded DNA-binding protein [Pelistega europaea]|uniref:Single-stranded DNA-binding protein n=1 Tax=Pelistega europaea TaxID=106147 RepID=A0A7Y4L913_9BURK|nr:single-stranded DNA-binding protein [Pelistega europaea]NOL49205.1 single-stranded DNA-binding protein [Pelistega europaea]
MIEALLHGKIARTPEQRQAKNGNTFTVSSMTVSSNNDLIFVSVIAFDDEVQADLLQLTKGDKASVSGTLKS